MGATQSSERSTMTEAWVTLATNDGYALGALVLAESLRLSNTTKRLHIMYTAQVSPSLRDQLDAAFDDKSMVDVLDSQDEVNLTLIQRPDLGVTFTKLHCWRLTQYEKAVFLDADTLVLQNSDDLFERDEFSAAPDIGWPDIFNTGVFVFRPSLETYKRLLEFAISHGSFDGGDQGLLNEFFNDWREKEARFRLPFSYNMTAGAVYTYAAAHKRFGKDTRIVHFLGTQKPWHQRGGTAHSLHSNTWWQIYDGHVASSLPAAQHQELVSGIAAMPSQEERQRAWEVGQPDYLGHDKFDNIQKALDRAMQQE